MKYFRILEKFHCCILLLAFKKNGFSTKIQAPESDKQENFVVDFVKDIYMVLNLDQFN